MSQAYLLSFHYGNTQEKWSEWCIERYTMLNAMLNICRPPYTIKNDFFSYLWRMVFCCLFSLLLHVSDQPCTISLLLFAKVIVSFYGSIVAENRSPNKCKWFDIFLWLFGFVIFGFMAKIRSGGTNCTILDVSFIVKNDILIVVEE